VSRKRCGLWINAQMRSGCGGRARPRRDPSADEIVQSFGVRSAEVLTTRHLLPQIERPGDLLECAEGQRSLGIAAVESAGEDHLVPRGMRKTKEADSFSTECACGQTLNLAGLRRDQTWTRSQPL
jgi:hypothetical protein